MNKTGGLKASARGLFGRHVNNTLSINKLSIIAHNINEHQAK
jgi:hypothetical protein